jgi:hypothetical protein
LRLAPDKEDGQIVFWAAGGTSGRANIPEAGRNQVDYPVGAPTRAVAWSPDYGDYWANINPRITVQDMEAESSTILYIVNFASDVQKMPYLTTAWSSSYATVDAGPFAHTIDVYPEDKVGIGTARIAFMAFVSTNGGQAFRPAVRGAQEGPPTYGYHILFDTDYEENGMVYVASDRINTGRIYRNKLPELGGSPWEDMVTPNTAHREYYGITQTNSDNVNNQGTLYVAHDSAVQTFGILIPIHRIPTMILLLSAVMLMVSWILVIPMAVSSGRYTRYGVSPSRASSGTASMLRLPCTAWYLPLLSSLLSRNR